MTPQKTIEWHLPGCTRLERSMRSHRRTSCMAPRLWKCGQRVRKRLCSLPAALCSKQILDLACSLLLVCTQHEKLIVLVVIQPVYLTPEAKEGTARKQRVLKGLEPKHLWCAVPPGRVWFVHHLCVKPLVWRLCWWMAGRSAGRSVWGSVRFV